MTQNIVVILDQSKIRIFGNGFSLKQINVVSRKVRHYSLTTREWKIPRSQAIKEIFSSTKFEIIITPCLTPHTTSYRCLISKTDESVQQAYSDVHPN
jgi:hypothetical protein